MSRKMMGMMFATAFALLVGGLNSADAGLFGCGKSRSNDCCAPVQECCKPVKVKKCKEPKVKKCKVEKSCCAPVQTCCAPAPTCCAPRPVCVTPKPTCCAPRPTCCAPGAAVDAGHAEDVPAPPGSSDAPKPKAE